MARPSSKCMLRCCTRGCRAVDEGTNPDSFTVQLFRDSMAQNQARWVAAACHLGRLPVWVGLARLLLLPFPTSLPVTALCSKGKVEAFRMLQQRVSQQLQQAYPAVAADYQQLRQPAPAEQAAGAADQQATAAAAAPS